MFKLIAREQGNVQSVENFDTFEGLKKHLIVNDYFSWILDEEPEKVLPNFEEVEDVEDIQLIFDEFDYSWWSMEVKIKQYMNEMDEKEFLERAEQIKVINKQIEVYENLRNFVNTDTYKTLIIKEIKREGRESSVVMVKEFEDAFYYFLTDVIDELEDKKGEILSGDVA